MSNLFKGTEMGLTKGKRIIVVRNSKIHGRGVFANRIIKKGERIIEYKGEKITPDEEERRYGDVDINGNGNGDHHTFLFYIDDEITIDATLKGNSARYINHSCEPNCESIDEEGHIFIEAIKNISPGVELTYDYSFEPDEDDTLEEAIQNYPCRCGKKKCRKTILKFSNGNS
ncbi:MAG: SET domain-containing protein-lysine N-methyltransferase [candidate division Zixibacteria bacterium]|nr:SET domain-containing protein-lysine N-methyltransferase [candidate division Zixibacteria bacterium]